MTTINLDDVNQELAPEEVEELEQIEPKEVSNQNSPFANMMSNLMQGGGRQRKQGLKGKYFLYYKTKKCSILTNVVEVSQTHPSTINQA
jgi:hypothetical protein